MLVRCPECGYLRSSLSADCDECLRIAREASKLSDTRPVSIARKNEPSVNMAVGMLAFLAMFLLALAFCARSSQDGLKDSSAAAIVSGEDAVRTAAKDPSSIEFGDVWAGTMAGGMYVACGYFNGKNSFGGYVGMCRFIATSTAVMTDTDADAAFESQWNTTCRH